MDYNQMKYYISTIAAEQTRLLVLAADQKAFPQHIQRCPRCGQPQQMHGTWTLSCHEQVLICPACKKDEISRKTEELILPLDQWHVFRILNNAGNFPCRPVLKAIDLELQDDPYVVQATFECWFSVADKFDIDFSQYPDDTYINLYANYHVLTGHLTMFYTIDDDDKMESFIYVPTAHERRSVIANMEDECMEKNNCTLAGLAQMVSQEQTEACSSQKTQSFVESELGGFVKNTETGEYELMFATEIGSVMLTHNRAVEAAANKNRFGNKKYDLSDVIVKARGKTLTVHQWKQVKEVSHDEPYAAHSTV